VNLPENPSIDWLRKLAKNRLREVRTTDKSARLSEAQFQVARLYGFASWRAMKSHIDSLAIEGQLIQAARAGDAGLLEQLLEKHPDKLHMHVPPYEASLLFPAAQSGNVAVVELLVKLGLDVNYREKGDNTYAMHWAAAAGMLEVVRFLADAGGDVVGEGDDHQLQVIGWATCWNGCDDAAHRAVADFLVSRGAKHHIFSAIAMELAEEVRRIVAQDPAALNARMSRNENHQTPVHFAVRMKRPAMVALLMELGADPLAVDGAGVAAPAYAEATGVDRALMERIHRMLTAELDSAARGRREPNVSPLDLLAAVSLREWGTAARVLQYPRASAGVLHILSKRGDAEGVEWLLSQGANPDAMWAHWDADVTPLHLAVLADHIDIVRMLLKAGADPRIRDSKHDSDAPGWAEFFRRNEILELLKADAA
jgi:ankyrin repeat protein